MKKAATLAATLFAASMALPVLAQGAKMPGAKEAQVPPRLIMEDGFRKWDRPEAFGPVPANLMETGRKVCATMNTGNYEYEPVGYHSRAMDSQGYEFQGGGYFCVQKKRK
jgi:hypothetical protein